MLTVVCVSSHAAKNGSHSPRVDRRESELGRDLGEADRVDAPVGVAPDLGGGELGVPQRHDRQRDEPATRVAAPLLDHPVVVGLHARRGRGPCPCPRENVWPQKRGNVGKQSEASTWLTSMSSRRACGVVAAGAHLVVGDRRRSHLVAVEADRGDVATVGDREVLVEPHVARVAVVAPSRARRSGRPRTSCRPGRGVRCGVRRRGTWRAGGPARRAVVRRRGRRR